MKIENIKYGIIIDNKVYEAVAIDPLNNSSYRVSASCMGCDLINKCENTDLYKVCQGFQSLTDNVCKTIIFKET